MFIFHALSHLQVHVSKIIYYLFKTFVYLFIIRSLFQGKHKSALMPRHCSADISILKFNSFSSSSFFSLESSWTSSISWQWSSPAVSWSLKWEISWLLRHFVRCDATEEETTGEVILAILMGCDTIVGKLIIFSQFNILTLPPVGTVIDDDWDEDPRIIWDTSFPAAIILLSLCVSQSSVSDCSLTSIWQLSHLT